MYEMPANQKDGCYGLFPAYTMAAIPMSHAQGDGGSSGLHGLQVDVMAPTAFVGFAPVEVRLTSIKLLGPLISLAARWPMQPHNPSFPTWVTPRSSRP
jgi:hypothetical protein